MGPNGREGPGAPLRIRRGSEVPLRRQIAMRLEAGIRDGGYAEGTRLPSVRAMGQRLGVHRETVASAYRELVHQGLVTAVPGSGVYVSPRKQLLTHALGGHEGALAMRLASLSAAIRMRRVLLQCDERALGEVVGAELQASILGLTIRCEPPPARPYPGVQFGWLPIRVLCGRGVASIDESAAGDSALRPTPLRAGLSGFDLKVLSMLRFPSIVGILSHSAIVRQLVREAVRGGAGPDIGVVSASPDDGPGMRRLRARSSLLAWDSVMAAGVPRVPGRRHLLLRLVPAGVISELLELLGENNRARRRSHEAADRVCESPIRST